MQSVCMANHFAVLDTPKHYDFDSIDEILKNLEYFLRNDFLILRDSLIICIYLSFFKENRLQAFSWSERHMSLQLKITKTGFGPIIKYISGPFNEFLLLERNLLF